MRTVADIADVAVAFSADDRLRAGIVADATEAMRSADRPADVEVIFGRRAASRPDRPWDHADGEVRLWWDSGTLVIGHGSVTARVDESGAVIGGRGDLKRAFRQILPYALTHLLAPAGRFVLHAAAVARTGGAVLILGPTGSGKSTLTVAALGAGWSILGDDLVVVRLRGTEAEARGVSRPVIAPRPALEAAGVAGVPVEGDRRHRWRVDQPTESERWHALTRTVVTRWDDDPTGRESLDSAGLIEWLVFSFLSARDETRLRAYLPVAAAMTRSGGAQISQGPRSQGLADLVELPGSTGSVGQGLV